MSYRSPKLNDEQLKQVLESKGAVDALTVYETVVITPETPFAERTIADLVSKLRQWGNLSEKQERFLLNLIEQVKERPAIEAQRKAERDAAPDVVSGSQVVRGTILKVSGKNDLYGNYVYKITLKTDKGNLLYGTLPRNIYYAERGDIVAFRADVKQSDKDPKFGFYSRPTQASIEGKASATA